MTAPVMVFDVESIGLHGEAFAVAGAVVGLDGRLQDSFVYAVDRALAAGLETDRVWVDEHVPPIAITHADGRSMRDAFWSRWLDYKARVGDKARLVSYVNWPVETNFLSACVADDPVVRKMAGPYPLYDVATLLAARGLDPLNPGDRIEGETTEHDPKCDVRYAARLWWTYIRG